MKKFVIVVCAIALSVVTASAQFTTSGGAKKSYSSSPDSKFGTFSVSYNPVTFKLTSGNSSTSRDMNGISLLWTDAYSVVPNVPVYFEYGVGAQWTFLNEKEEDENASINFLSLKVPVSLMYKFDVPQTEISLVPYAGLNLTGHILGQQKYQWDNGDSKESQTRSFFSKDDMGEDGTYNRFVVGWHIGAKVFIKKFLVGVAYEGPVTNLYKYDDDMKYNTSQVNISVGINF